MPAQYLLHELRSRLAAAPLRWDLVLQFPEPGDTLDDATRRWPDDRRTLVAGVELSNDPLLGFRSQVYAESHHRRTHEAREGAAPDDMGQ